MKSVFFRSATVHCAHTPGSWADKKSKLNRMVSLYSLGTKLDGMPEPPTCFQSVAPWLALGSPTYCVVLEEQAPPARSRVIGVLKHLGAGWAFPHTSSPGIMSPLSTTCINLLRLDSGHVS